MANPKIETIDYDVVIIGGGPAGLTAGIYAGRRNLKTLVLEGAVPGGQVAVSSKVENWPGTESIGGMELAEKMEKHARKYCEIRFENVTEIDVEGKTAVTEHGGYRGKALIIATGASHKKLQIPGEKEYEGKGVSYCATCDAPFFKGKRAAIVGGSSSAVSSAIYLKDYASEVHIIHRRDSFRAEEALVSELKQRGITIHWNSVVTEVKGNKKMDRAVLENVLTKEHTELPLDGLFIYIGLTPMTELAQKAGIETDQYGFIKVDREMQTNRGGIFACGDATGGILQITKAAGEGCIAGLSAYKYIRHQEVG